MIRILTVVILYCLSSLVFPRIAAAQDSVAAAGSAVPEGAHIAWVGQFPAAARSEKRSTVGRIYDFLVRKNKQASLLRPVAVVAKDPSDFSILDQGAQTIFCVEKNKEEIPRCIRKKENFFTSLVSACTLPGGEMIFSDSRLNNIYRVDADGKKVAAVNDSLHLQQPTGVAYSAANKEIWVVETGMHRVVVLDSAGQTVKTIGSRGDENGQFNYPTYIWIDKQGEAYIVDAMNFRVQIFNRRGEFVSAFGEAGDASGAMARPRGIATDGFGNIYVVDALFNTVQIFDRSGNLLYNFGVQGRDKGEFWMPSGIYIDYKNYIYIADNYNSRVQIFQLINGS